VNVNYRLGTSGEASHDAPRTIDAAGAQPLAALLAVVGPGVLAGLSDDDPAGVTTYSILGTDFGYQLLYCTLGCFYGQEYQRR
jgi:hypothetical protein